VSKDKFSVKKSFQKPSLTKKLGDAWWNSQKDTDEIISPKQSLKPPKLN
jgi:hypothetical protein